MDRYSSKEFGKRFIKDCQNLTHNYIYIKSIIKELLYNNIKVSDFPNVIKTVNNLLCGGLTFEEFKSRLLKFNCSAICGKVWTSKYFAYRCRTCALSPCMAICDSCFKGANHEGHDFNMFRSAAGGACDCGNSGVMKESGFCSHHGTNHVNRLAPPMDLCVSAKLILPHLLMYLIVSMRRYFLTFCKEKKVTAEIYVEETFGSLLDYLHELANVSSVVRGLMSDAMLLKTNDELFTDFVNINLTEYKNASREMLPILLTATHRQYVPEMKEQELVHKCLLDELLFWTIRYEFPEKIVTLLLILLPEEEYKVVFTQSFVAHYTRICNTLLSENRRDRDQNKVSNRMVHITVQLFSSESCALKLCETQNLLHIMLLCLAHLLEKSSVVSSIATDRRRRAFLRLNLHSTIMRKNVYWPVVSDFSNILRHKSVVQIFVAQHNLLSFWVYILNFFQSMNLNIREVNEHIEHEPQTYYCAFSAELEFCATVMWSMWLNCKNNLEICKRYINILVESLKTRWLCYEDDQPRNICIFNHLSFHLPMHRTLSILLHGALTEHKCSLMELMSGYHGDNLTSFWRVLMDEPLHTLVGFFEILSGLWIRNGLQIKGQAMTYVQHNFCNSLVDADLFLLQLAITQLDSEIVVNESFDRFRLREYLLLISPAGLNSPVYEWERAGMLLESWLLLLSWLITLRESPGAGTLRRELVAILCIKARTHSQISDHMPYRSGIQGAADELYLAQLLEGHLSVVADLAEAHEDPAGGLKSRIYSLKEGLWTTDYDPLFCHLRALYSRDATSAATAFYEYVKRRKLISESTQQPWPPYRFPRCPFIGDEDALMALLQSRSLHAILFMCLFKFLYSTHISENALSLVIFLLELGVEFEPQTCKTMGATDKDSHLVVMDGDFTSWFHENSLQYNLSQVIESCEGGSDGDVNTVRRDGSDSKSVEMHDDALWRCSTAAKTKSSTMTLQANQSSFISVNESFLSLLVKLHRRLSDNEVWYCVPTSQTLIQTRQLTKEMRRKSEKRLGGAMFWVTNLLDKICLMSDDNCHHVCRIVTELSSDFGSVNKRSQPFERSQSGEIELVLGANSRETAAEERKRNAKERQKRLMDKIANKQRAFAAKFKDEIDDMEMQIDESENPTEEIVECVICKTEVKTNFENPSCLVAFARNNCLSNLYHDHSNEREHFSSNLKEKVVFWRDMLNTIEENMVASLRNGIFYLNNLDSNMAIKSCGHVVHYKCQIEYGASRSQRTHGVLECPLCRQLYNLVIPLCCVAPSPTQDIVNDVDFEAKLKEERFHVLENIKFVFACDHKKNNASNGVIVSSMTVLKKLMEKRVLNARSMPIDDYTLISSVIRSALQIEWIVAETSNNSNQVEFFQRRTCTSSLLRFLTDYFHLVVFNEQTESCEKAVVKMQVLSNLLEVLNGNRNASSMIETSTGRDKNCRDKSIGIRPLLLQDPFSLLLLFHLQINERAMTWPFLLRALYNLAYGQALLRTAANFSMSERRAWQRHSSSSAMENNSSNSLESHLVEVFCLMESLHLFPSVEVDSFSMDFWCSSSNCASVITLQSAEAKVRQHMLPFLRLALLFRTHWPVSCLNSRLTATELYIIAASTPFDEQWPILLQRLGLLKNVNWCTKLKSAALIPNAADLVTHLDIPFLHLLRNWCSELNETICNDVLLNTCSIRASVLHYFQLPTLLAAPHLLNLPERYELLLERYRGSQCDRKGLNHDQGALCLICGALCCHLNEACFGQSHLSEVSLFDDILHAQECSAGLGLFLLVAESSVMVVNHHQFGVWGSIYLDQFGETDIGLKRGKPLVLNESHFKLLQHQWITQTVDRNVRRWESASTLPVNMLF